MRLPFQDFINYWTGRYCEVAGSANAQNQCVDLANAYIRDVLKLPIIEWTNAVDFPSKAGDKYEYILNTPTNVPQRGDIIIWKPFPGHIAIFIEGNANRFTSFDQNFPVGSKCHIQEHTYQNVTGWLRAKGGGTVDQQKIIDELRADRDKNWNLYQAEILKTKSLQEKLTACENKPVPVNEDSKTLAELRSIIRKIIGI